MFKIVWVFLLTAFALHASSGDDRRLCEGARFCFSAEVQAEYGSSRVLQEFVIEVPRGTSYQEFGLLQTEKVMQATGLYGTFALTNQISEVEYKKWCAQAYICREEDVKVKFGDE